MKTSKLNLNVPPPVDPRPLTFHEIWTAGWVQGAVLVGAVLAAVAYAYLAPL
jgi:hypothetical protein